MTSKLITLTALASALVASVGCSSVATQPPPPAYGAVTPAPGYAPSSYEAVQYGYVRNISQLEASRRPSGAGALLGAVIGGVVGNQIGAGNGRVAATGVGAVAGAVAGNRIEENANRGGQVYYQVDVRLDSGEMRSFDYMDLNGLRVGDRVRLADNQLQRW